MKKLITISLLGLFCACSAKLMTPTQADVDRVSKKYPGYTLADLSKGKALFEEKCTQCHAAKNPTSKNEEQWKKTVPRMAAKAKKRGKSEISEAQQETILKYLITMSMAGNAAK